MEEYEKAGLKIVKCSTITKVENKGDDVKKSLTLSVVKGNETVLMDGFEEVVFAIGRKANTKDLNLDVTDVKTNKDGFVISDEWQNTQQEGAYAVGDVCGVAMLTPG